ncbi:MAG: hypothetical protein GY707_07885 [Desulfobacteraceae bacterium]|nr:hypothetical protein [Desulfobacteraceae bacterium]
MPNYTLGNRTLKRRWFDLFETLTEDTFIEEGFSELTHKYSEKHRHYHNINHIQECLTTLDRINTHVSDTFSLEVSIWFHDVIYDPKNSKNEKLSAQFAKSFLINTSIDRKTIQRIEHLINLTKHPSKPQKSDEKYLIDIDLMILGSNFELFREYEINIRKEYSFVPYFLFKKGRMKLLNAFLNSQRIYHTDYFFNNYEDQARINLKTALSELICSS